MTFFRNADSVHVVKTEIGCEERLLNDLFLFELDAKIYIRQRLDLDSITAPYCVTVLQLLCARGELELVSEALAKLTDVRKYSLSRLQQRPLPEGVDAQKLETYLNDEEFQVSYLWVF